MHTLVQYRFWPYLVHYLDPVPGFHVYHWCFCYVINLSYCCLVQILTLTLHITLTLYSGFLMFLSLMFLVCMNPVTLLSSTDSDLDIVHHFDPILWVFDVFITDVFGVYEPCHTVVQYRFWPWHCTSPWPYPLGFWCFYHWCFWCVWTLSHCCPVQILTLTLYITLTLSSGFLMFLSLMFLVCMNPVTLLSSTDSDLDLVHYLDPILWVFDVFITDVFGVYEPCHTVV